MPSGDTKAKNKKPSAIQPGMILSLVLCVGLGAGVAYALPENESFFAVFLFGLAGFCVSFALQTILHETGHLIGGLLTGYKFCSFRIGNLQLQRENGALRFRRLKLAGTGGQCLMTPPEPVDGKIPVMLYNLAGPLMNLLTALLALGGYFLSGGGSMGASLLFLFAFVGFYLALTNGIPLRLGPIDNDGKNAFSLRRDPEAMRAFYLQMAVNSRQTEGERLRDMPDEWFVMPSDEAMQNALVAATGVFCCSRLMDEHRFAEAHEAMSRLLSGGGEPRRALPRAFAVRRDISGAPRRKPPRHGRCDAHKAAAPLHAPDEGFPERAAHRIRPRPAARRRQRARRPAARPV